jgi:phosphatidylglycerophosphate synthase
VRGPISPNQVTVASLLAGLLAAGLIAQARLPVLLGLACFQLSVVLDHADGEIARLKFQFTKLGKWLDNWSDHAVDLAVLGGVAWRAASGAPVVGLIALAIVAGIGVTGSFVVVFVWTLRRAPGAPGAHPMLALANRDGFCLALWGTLLLGWPVLLLWLLAIGANAFWLVWLLTGPRRSPAR